MAEKRTVAPVPSLGGSKGRGGQQLPPLLPYAVLGALGTVLVILLAWSRLPSEWRVSAGLGIVLLLAAAASGFPLLLRSRNELRSAQRLLLVATRRMEEAYERLLETNEQLQQTAAARDRALTELRAAVRERESFLDAVAHDLKTPLTVIKGHTDLLSATTARRVTPPEPAVARGLARIAENTEQMRVMIDELLSLARLDLGEHVLPDTEPTELVELARSAIANAGIANGRHRFLLDVGAEPIVGEWDRQRIERMLANLLSNATKYSPAGGTVTVTISMAADGETAEISVSDEGIGIPADDLERVFHRFYRARNAPEGVPGTGLGLASVRQTAELHGGSVEVQSCEGSGSTFTVRLPVQYSTTQ